MTAGVTQTQLDVRVIERFLVRGGPAGRRLWLPDGHLRALPFRNPPK
ncbi:MAG: hypothetical protein JO100_11785 [Pseudonocardia sp.]|nr:hypothetical protein [Pseudonocardia sp.]